MHRQHAEPVPGAAGGPLTPARGNRLARFEAIRIVAFATFAAMLYGIVHDLATAHLCIEYFTIAHPPLFPNEDPLLLALGWGIAATWWVGLFLGIGLAAAARLGAAPKLGLADLRRRILLLMLAVALAACLAGASGAALFASGTLPLLGGWGDLIPSDRHTAFSAAAWAHMASYAAGGGGGILVILQTLRSRRRLRQRGAETLGRSSEDH